MILCFNFQRNAFPPRAFMLNPKTLFTHLRDEKLPWQASCITLNPIKAIQRPNIAAMISAIHPGIGKNKTPTYNASVTVIRTADFIYSLALPVFLILLRLKYSSTELFRLLKNTLLLLLKLTLYCIILWNLNGEHWWWIAFTRLGIKICKGNKMGWIIHVNLCHNYPGLPCKFSW